MNTSKFSTLKEHLARLSWPDVYLYKFIMKADNEKIARIDALFDEDAEISMGQSSNGKYVSITAREVAISPEEIIGKYEAASQIEGVMSL